MIERGAAAERAASTILADDLRSGGRSFQD